MNGSEDGGGAGLSGAKVLRALEAQHAGPHRAPGLVYGMGPARM